MAYITCAVPQGVTLGPLFFLICLNLSGLLGLLRTGGGEICLGSITSPFLMLSD